MPEAEEVGIIMMYFFMKEFIENKIKIIQL
jgi:hypothetical protein